MGLAAGGDRGEERFWELTAKTLGAGSLRLRVWGCLAESLILGVKRKDSLELRVWGLQPAAIAGKSGFGS